MSTLGERLKRARKLRGYTQPELVRRLRNKYGEGSQGLISQIEKGINDGSKLVPAIADVLDVPVDWLYSGKGDDPSAPGGQAKSPKEKPDLVSRLVSALGPMIEQDGVIQGLLTEKANLERQVAALKAQVATLQREQGSQRKPKGGS